MNDHSTDNGVNSGRVTVTDLANGQYDLSFTAPVAATYSVNVALANGKYSLLSVD